MAQSRIVRDAPVVPVAENQALDRDTANRIVVDLNLRLDRIYDALVAMDARLQAIGG